MSSRTPYIDLLLGNPVTVREGAMGMPSYGVSALMAYLNDFFLDPNNSANRFVTPPPDLEGKKLPPGKFLYVNEQFSWGMDMVNSRGRIVVTGPDASIQPVGIARGMLNQSLTTGRRTNLSLASHNYMVECYGREGAAVQSLAQIAFSSIHTMADKIRAQLGLVQITAATLGRERTVFPPAGSSRQELTMVPLSVTMLLSCKYDTFPTGPKMGNLGIIVEDDQSKTVVDKIGTG